ncbi:hypothetical protein FA13DRAFT_1689797 [Coprinellus micaceus]|uniref:Uncharacterized protein n=1 Tax=Coprinellus micaceus TaxID=71717 RepID=A0A4Y7T6Z7_COPMI|nr:hypothetical protein FA13DRAFT_1689797 [Coprinellus micaceus]
MRQYLVSKLPDPDTRPLNAGPPHAQRNEPFAPHKDPKLTAIPEYKGVLYGRRCLSTQKVILEYLLGRCLQQMQTCLHELEQAEAASSRVESSADYVLRVGEENGIPIDADGLDAESCRLYQKVRSDLHELGEEMMCLDGAREVTEEFRRDPEAFLRHPRNG